MLTRTKNQADIYAREVAKLREVGVEMSVAIFRNRQEMCARAREDGRLAELSYHDFLRFCAGLRRRAAGRVCEPYEATLRDGWRPSARALALVEELAKRGASMPEEVYGACEASGLCAYEVTKLLASRATVVIGSYNYALLPPVRASVLPKAKLRPSLTCAVFDEAHSLPRYVVDLFSDELSTRSVARALEEARRFNVSGEPAALLEHLHSLALELGAEAEGEVGVGEELLVDPLEVSRELAERAGLGGVEELLELASELEAEGERVRVLKEAEGRAPSSYVARCAVFLQSWVEVALSGADAYACYAKSEREAARLGVRCLDASAHAHAINSFRASLLMSGTLWAPDYYIDSLGLDRGRSRYLSLPYPFPKRNRAILVDLASTSKYERRSPELWDRVAERVGAIVSALRGRAAVYAPSYDVLREVAARLKLDRPVFIEREASRVREALEFLRRNADGVLLGVAGGKLSEGVDLTDEGGRGLLSAVIIVGLPYPKKGQLQGALVKFYRAKFGPLADEYAWEAPCIIALAQAAGRLIRGPEDRGAIIIMDYRASRPRFKARLPEDWREDMRARRSLAKIISDLAELALVRGQAGR
ncbi:MAG: ATP-dependent DNA helicase [Candidatus Nezhaarchaeales archaeon]